MVTKEWEMEVWVLRSYVVTFIMKKTTTFRWDNVTFRSSFSEGSVWLKINTTQDESFSLLLTELKSLCINVVC
ncbi:MAG: hypothetical protein ACTS5A_00620 [Candidatus Hodgkinia cicadicola]